MRLLTCLLLALGAAGAATAEPSSLPQPAAESTIVIHNRDIPRLVIFAWERNGRFINARPGDGQEVPYDATRNQVKIMPFPSGSVRELLFAKGSRTHPHLNREDIYTYGVTARRVHIINEQSFQNEPGDASFQPAGVSHHAETLRAGLAIEIAFPGKIDPNAEPTWITGRTPALVEVAEWAEGGRLVRAWDAAAQTAPAGAVRYQAKRFAFREGPLEELHLKRGVKTPTAARSGDLIGYVVTGRVRITVDGRSDEAEAGDAVREPSGHPFSREALEDTVLVEVVSPVGPHD